MVVYHSAMVLPLEADEKPVAPPAHEGSTPPADVAPTLGINNRKIPDGVESPSPTGPARASTTPPSSSRYSPRFHDLQDKIFRIPSLSPELARVKKCLRVPRKDARRVAVKAYADGKAGFGGLCLCGRPTGCPVCRARRAGDEREELRQAVQGAVALGLEPRMVTLTVPHQYGQAYRPLFDKLKEAWHRLVSSSGWRHEMTAAGLAGYRVCLEVTFGEHGAHPHYHVLLFVRPGAVIDEVTLLELWQEKVVAAGLPCPNEHGLQVSACTDIERLADYAASAAWGLDAEVIDAEAKQGRAENSLTVFQLLERVSTPEELHAAGKVFVEYLEAMHGRHVVSWTKGLKARLLSAAPPADVAPTLAPAVVEIHEISTTLWASVSVVPGARARVLDLFIGQGWSVAEAYIAQLHQRVVARRRAYHRRLLADEPPHPQSVDLSPTRRAG